VFCISIIPESFHTELELFARISDRIEVHYIKNLSEPDKQQLREAMELKKRPLNDRRYIYIHMFTFFVMCALVSIFDLISISNAICLALIFIFDKHFFLFVVFIVLH
jgi:hypothetical protein